MALRFPMITLLLALSAHTAAAQTAPAGRAWPVELAHVAKWPALAATVGMLARGFLLSRDADRWHDSLVAACAVVDPCPRSTSGRYLLPRAQSAYESYLDANGRARGWIVSGELTLVATGAMFLVDLINRSDGPRNIPFTPFSVYATPQRLGLSLDFPSRRP